MYFVGIGKGHDIPVLCAGGTANHAHLLIALPATMPLAKAVQVLKANSSRWLGEHRFDFAWQEGYGAFSVSTSNVSAPSNITSSIRPNIMRNIRSRMNSCRCCGSAMWRMIRNSYSGDEWRPCRDSVPQ